MAGKGQWLKGYYGWRVITPAAWKVTQGLNNNSFSFLQSIIFCKNLFKEPLFSQMVAAN